MKVKFLPEGVEHEIAPGQSIMDLAHSKGILIKSTCNGLPSCAECRVRVVDGDWNTNPPSRKELSLIGTGHYIDQRRLSCQTICFGDVTVDISEQLERAAEGPVTKKFLTKVHKSSAEESHSVGGVLIEQDTELMHSLKTDVQDVGTSSSGVTAGSDRQSARGSQSPRHDQKGDRQNHSRSNKRRGGRFRRKN